MKRLSFLALLSAQVCFAGTPLSNKDSEPAKKATTVVVTSKTSADAASVARSQPKTVFLLDYLPEDIIHIICGYVRGVPLIPPYVGPDGKKLPVYPIEQRGALKALANSSARLKGCVERVFPARYIERLSLERFEELDEQNTLSTNPLHCYDVKLVAHILADEIEAILSQANAPGQPYVPALTLEALRLDVLGRNLEHFASWKETLNAHAKIRSKSLHIKLPASELSDFFSPKYETVRSFFDDIEITASLTKHGLADLKEVYADLTKTQKRMISALKYISQDRTFFDLAAYPYVKTFTGWFPLAPLSGHTSIEQIGTRCSGVVAEQISHCPQLHTLFLSDNAIQSSEDPVCIRIQDCKNLQNVQLNLINTNADFQIEGCPHAQVTVKRRVNFFLKEDGAERLARYAAQERQRVQLTIKNAIEGDAFVSLLQDAPTHVQKYFSHITAAGQTTDQPAVYLDLNQLPYVRYLSGGALANLINHPSLEELETTINRVSHCPALRKCALFPSKNATSPLLVEGCDLLKELRLLQDTRGVEVRDCAALEKIDIQTIDPYKQVRSLKFARLLSLKEIDFWASTPLVRFESCHNLRRLRIGTEGCVFLDGCSKLKALDYSPRNCPSDIIALDTPLCKSRAEHVGETFLKRFITNDIDQKLPGYLARAIEAGVVQQHDMALMIYVLSPRGTKAMRVALNSLPPQAQVWDVDRAVQGVLDGKGNLVHKELRG